MSYGMRSGDYFSKYDDRYGSGNRSSGLSRSSMNSGMRYMGDSGSQFRDRDMGFRDSYSRTNSNSFSGMGGYVDRNRQRDMRMQDYDMGFNDMQGGRSFNDARSPRNVMMRGMKRNMSPGSSGFGVGARPHGGMGMGGGMSSSLATTEALLTLGLQAKKILENQNAYGPPAPKMRRLNEGYGVGRGRGRGVMQRRSMRGGVLNRSRGSSYRDRNDKKPRPVPAWKKNPYHCNFCRVETKNKKDHTDHVKSKEHITAVKAREVNLQTRMHSIHNRSQAEAEAARMQGAIIKFCSICCLEYTGRQTVHKKSKEHMAKVFMLQVQCPDCEITIPNRIQFERHNVTHYHIRNSMYKLLEAGELVETDEDLECPEEYDEERSLGNQYVVDVKAIFCKVCDEMFVAKDTKVFKHCKTEEHYEKFKEFVAKRKQEIEEKAAADKLKKEEEEALAAAAKDKKDEDDIKEEDAEDETEGAEDKDDEGDDVEAEDGDAEEDGEQEVEDENEDFEMAEEEGMGEKDD